MSAFLVFGLTLLIWLSVFLSSSVRSVVTLLCRVDSALLKRMVRLMALKYRLTLRDKHWTS